MPAGRRVVQPPVAGQLVGLLAVFAASLAVALAGQAAVAGQLPAGPPGGQAQVDPRPHGVGALRLLFRAACGQHHRGRRVAEQRHGLAELWHRHPGDPLDQLRPVRHRRGPRRRPATGAGRDELLVRAPLGDHQVQQAQRQRQVRTGARREMQIGLFGGAGPAGIDDDQPPAVLPELGQMAQRRRHGLRQVGADQQHAPGPRHIGQRERQPPVQPERPALRRRGRRHAEPAVVVDLRRAQHHPRELPQRIRLLVGQPAAAEHPDRVPPVHRAGPPQALRDPVQGRVPTGRHQLPGVRVAHQGSRQARPGGEQFVRGAPLAAQRAPVHGERGPLHNLHRRAARPGGGPQPHAALQGAVGAVGLDRGGGDGVHTGQRGTGVLRRRIAPVSGARRTPPTGPQAGRGVAVHGFPRRETEPQRPGASLAP